MKYCGAAMKPIFYPYGQGEMPIALSPREQGSHGICHRVEGQISDPEFQKSLRAMIENDWVCYNDILINGDPSGKITRGCYVKS